MFIFGRGGGWHLFPLIPWSLNTGMNAKICITIRNAIQDCVCSQNVFFRWTTKHYAHEIIWFTQYHTHEWICCNTLKSTSVNSRVLWKPFCCKMAQAISVSLVFIWHPWTSKYTGRWLKTPLNFHIFLQRINVGKTWSFMFHQLFVGKSVNSFPWLLWLFTTFTSSTILSLKC